MLEGEIAYRRGEHDAAFAHLRAAALLEDDLPYDEPWGWMQPVRHALGALLLEQGRTAEAEAVYREDLGLGGALPRAQIHPENVWALRGILSCLERRGALKRRADPAARGGGGRPRRRAGDGVLLLRPPRRRLAASPAAPPGHPPGHPA